MLTGTYLTLVEPLVVRVSACLDSKSMQTVKSGKLISVVETRLAEKGNRVRGRLRSGGWISLVNTKEMEKFAKKFERRSTA